MIDAPSLTILIALPEEFRIIPESVIASFFTPLRKKEWQSKVVLEQRWSVIILTSRKRTIRLHEAWRAQALILACVTRSSLHEKNTSREICFLSDFYQWAFRRKVVSRRDDFRDPELYCTEFIPVRSCGRQRCLWKINIAQSTRSRYPKNDPRLPLLRQSLNTSALFVKSMWGFLSIHCQKTSPVKSNLLYSGKADLQCG